MTLLEIVAPEEYNRLASFAVGEVTLGRSQDKNSWTNPTGQKRHIIDISSVVMENYGPAEIAAELAHEAVHLDESLPGNSMYEEVLADQKRRNVAESIKWTNPYYRDSIPDYSDIEISLPADDPSLLSQLRGIQDERRNEWGPYSGKQPSKADIIYSYLPLGPPSKGLRVLLFDKWIEINLKVSGY
jgi:hypothetical protein